jgi:hypothetical protein
VIPVIDLRLRFTLEALISDDADIIAAASGTPSVRKAVGGRNAVIFATLAYSDNAVGKC